MNLIVITALIAVCGAAKLDRTYLPSSADTAGGSSGPLQAPGTRRSEPALDTPSFPTGSYTNNFGGVVVDAAAADTRSSEGQSGLGGPRPSYGSSDSKVGDAAFRGSVAGFRGTPSFGTASGQGQNIQGQFHTQTGNGFSSNGHINTHAAQGFPVNGQIHTQSGSPGQFSSNVDNNGQRTQAGQSFQSFENKSERPQAAKDRNSNILALSNDVNTNSYSYGFETDNGIAVGENGVVVNGIQAEGGYSYLGDDGQVYKVTYVADELGYRPQGAHLPTPPPIPEEILKSLQQNAKEEASGIVDDGSYDTQKYNTDGDYTRDNGGNIQYNGAQLSQFGKRPESDATAIGNQNQGFARPESTQFGTGSNAQSNQQFGTVSNGNSAINGQVNGPFGAASNPQISYNGQANGKPATGQFGFTGSQSFNGQSSQVHNQPESSQLGSGSQGTFGQSSLENQFDSSSVNSHIGSQNSHSSHLSGHKESLANGPVFGQTGTQPSSSSGQAQSGFGRPTQFGSQFNQQASSIGQHDNQSPHFSSQQQGFNNQLNTGNIPANSQSQSTFGSSFKPQGSVALSDASLNQDQDSHGVGKPNIPQTFSGQNFNRPSVGNVNNNKQTNGQGQTNNGINQFPQSSGQFGAQNEYLPPLNLNGQQQSKPELTSNFGTSEPNSNGQAQGQGDKNPAFVALNRPGSASAFASTSFGQPAFQPQPAAPLNAINTQTQSKPNQFPQQQTIQSNQQTNQLSAQTPDQFNSNSQQSSSFAAQTISNFGSKPTAVPDTELTTPLEPNETSQGSQFSSQTTSSFGFGSKPSNSLTQAQFGFQGHSGSGEQSISQNLSPTFPTSSPNTNSQFGTSPTTSAFQSSENNSNNKPQSTQNSFSQTQQHHGTDNSYYYNQPSKTFGTPVKRPQGSRFPVSPSYQSNGVATQNQFFNTQSFQSSTKFPGSPSLAPVGPTSATQFGQTQGYNGITQAAISPFPAISPTSTDQFGTTQNSQFGNKPSFNQQSTFSNQEPSLGAKPSNNQQSTFGYQGQINVNQDETSSVPEPITGRFPPATVGQINKYQENKFPTRPNSLFSQKVTSSQTQNQFEQPESITESLDGSSQQTLTQQYQGTIYEYNKPAEVLPAAAQSDSSSSQTIQTGIALETKPSFGQPQGNHLPKEQNLKPFSQMGNDGSKVDTQNKPFSSSSNTNLGQHSQTSHGTQNPQQTGIQFGSQPAKPFNALTSTNTQFGANSQPGAQPTPTYTQTGQTASYGSSSQSIQSTFGSKPQFGSQTTQFGQQTQSSGSSLSQPEKVPGSQSQYSSQTFQNSASSQNNGYDYPGNPKPQFAEETNNQFSQNTVQSGNSQITGFFNQQSPQSYSASQPQFGSQSQNPQNTQATFGQRVPNSPIQPFSQPQFGQSTASSQAFASGQATASASASNSPQNYKSFAPQNKNRFSQTQKIDHDQSGQGSQQFGAQNTKPFGSTKGNEANAKPFEANQGSTGSKPLFNSPCCQGSKDSASAQSTDGPVSASFQGSQSFNAQGFAAKGEQFGGPRGPPRFDEQTGYHY